MLCPTSLHLWLGFWEMLGLMEHARYGALVRVIGPYIGPIVIETGLLPYCQWPVVFKRSKPAYADDDDDGSCGEMLHLVQERIDLPQWFLNCFVTDDFTLRAVFRGFFGPLEICAHLAKALEQGRDGEDNQDTCAGGRSRLSSEEVKTATNLLSALPDHSDWLSSVKATGGDNPDLLRALLDRFQFKIKPGNLYTIYSLIRDDDADALREIVWRTGWLTRLCQGPLRCGTCLRSRQILNLCSLSAASLVIEHPDCRAAREIDSCKPPPTKRSRTENASALAENAPASAQYDNDDAIYG
jgi:hypothetical protein